MFPFRKDLFKSAHRYIMFTTLCAAGTRSVLISPSIAPYTRTFRLRRIFKRKKEYITWPPAGPRNVVIRRVNEIITNGRVQREGRNYWNTISVWLHSGTRAGDRVIIYLYRISVAVLRVKRTSIIIDGRRKLINVRRRNWTRLLSTYRSVLFRRS